MLCNIYKLYCAIKWIFSIILFNKKKTTLKESAGESLTFWMHAKHFTLFYNWIEFYKYVTCIELYIVCSNKHLCWSVRYILK